MEPLDAGWYLEISTCYEAMLVPLTELGENPTYEERIEAVKDVMSRLPYWNFPFSDRLKVFKVSKIIHVDSDIRVDLEFREGRRRRG